MKPARRASPSCAGNLPTDPTADLQSWHDRLPRSREPGWVPAVRSCELIPAKPKAFRAEAHSRREHKENKAVIYFKSVRLCASARVQLFFHSFCGLGRGLATNGQDAVLRSSVVARPPAYVARARTGRSPCEASNCSLPFAHCLLRTASCVLLTADCPSGRGIRACPFQNWTVCRNHVNHPRILMGNPGVADNSVREENV
jgi:hypothetical protein